LGFEIVSLDEMYERLTTGRSSRRFVCFTLDDGYADNYHHAAPVFEAHQVPFAIYVTTGFLDRTAYFWWMLLEEVIRRESSVTLRIEDAEVHRRMASVEEKTKVFNEFHGITRGLQAKGCLATAKRFADDHAIDPEKLCADHSMTWAMARKITERGFGKAEAHTVTHLALSGQEPDDIRAEMEQCCSRIEEQTGYRPRHFAYPFGDVMAASSREFEILRSLPILTATTTTEGMLLPTHAGDLSALPRLTLNGYYQSTGYIDVLLSGIGAFFARSIKRLRAEH
ncbi:MAG: polysaccharide deacetylase family protein, partial [Geminicoccaceae bacterium]